VYMSFCVFPDWLTCLLLVAGRAELFRRSVAQRTMRPDRVVFPAKPCPSRLCIRHALEFLPLKELVAQSTVKRFYISILPGASHGDRDRSRPHTRQPVHQCRANEFRSVVTPYASRRSAASNHPGQDPPHIGPRQGSGRMQHQTLPSIFVHQGQPLERSTSRCSIVNEVTGPNVVLEPGRLLNATVRTGPRFRARAYALLFPGFSGVFMENIL
jgi:hypothetical protein